MPDRHAILRAFVAVFRAVRGFLRTATAVFLALAATGFLALAGVVFLALATAGFLVLAMVAFLALPTALTEAVNSGLGGFAVRW